MSSSTSSVVPHPLDPLTSEESNTSRQAIIDARGADAVIRFRSIALEEPLKEELIRFLEEEHSGNLSAQTPRPARLAKVQYDVIQAGKGQSYIESCIDVNSKTEVKQRIVDRMHQAGITTYVSITKTDRLFEIGSGVPTRRMRIIVLTIY